MFLDRLAFLPLPLFTLILVLLLLFLLFFELAWKHALVLVRLVGKVIDTNLVVNCAAVVEYYPCVEI